jgi:hypothetical protein
MVLVVRPTAWVLIPTPHGRVWRRSDVAASGPPRTLHHLQRPATVPGTGAGLPRRCCVCPFASTSTHEPLPPPPPHTPTPTPFQIPKYFSTAIHSRFIPAHTRRRAAAVGTALLSCATLAVWVLVVAAKLEGALRASWHVVTVPLWVTCALLACFGALSHSVHSKSGTCAGAVRLARCGRFQKLPMVVRTSPPCVGSCGPGIQKHHPVPPPSPPHSFQNSPNTPSHQLGCLGLGAFFGVPSIRAGGVPMSLVAMFIPEWLVLL